MTVRMNWRENAACRDADPDLFFPIGTAGNSLRQADEAKRICRRCPAQNQCLAWALENGITDGVWGGTTENERRAIRSLDAATPAPLPLMTSNPAPLVRTFGGWSCEDRLGGLTTKQVLGLIRLLGQDVTGPACAQPPWSSEAVREFHLPGQGQSDEMPDFRLCVRLGREQDPHPQLAAVFGRADPVRRQRARRLVIPVPAQRYRNRRPRSPDIGIRLHHQDRLMSKGLAHYPSMPTSAR